jgi:hypothetical protein
MDAAAHSSVRRFIPAEFEGPPTRRPRPDPLDRDRAACIERLRFWSHHGRHRMPFTIFTCGVFYERFNRGGLGSLGIGTSSNCFYQGSYLMDVALATAETVEQRVDGTPAYVAMTSVYDVARFVVAAVEQLDLENWPAEFRLSGDRRTVAEIVQWAETVRGNSNPLLNNHISLRLCDVINKKLGVTFTTNTILPTDLQQHIEYATYYQDWGRVARMHELAATAQRRYDFTNPNLNQLVNVVPTTFWEWLSAHWAAP